MSNMNANPLRWLCGLAASIVLCGLLTSAKAANPPWPATVHLFALDPFASEEGTDPATFLVVRIGPADAPLTVNFAAGGTALNGTDYELLPGSVTIPSNSYIATITLTPLDDFEVEGAETAVLSLVQPPVWPPPYIVSWPSVAVAEIADNDSAPTNQPPSVAIVRPPNGAIFEAGDELNLVARAHDRDGVVRTVEFFDGDKSLGIVTNQPSIPTPSALALTAEISGLEFDSARLPGLDSENVTNVLGQLFRFVWEDPSPGHHVLTAVATDDDGATFRSVPVEITVLNPPPKPVVRVKASDPIATEPDPTQDFLDTATFVLHRTGPTNLPLTVYYRLGGTASNGVDYAELPNSTEIAAGERRVRVVVLPLDDLLVEGRESVVLSLVEPDCDDTRTDPDCYRVGRASVARAVIRDNDSVTNRPPLVHWLKPDDGEIFRAPADIRFAAMARDLDGYVKSVEFFEGTNSLGVVSNNPTALSAARPPFSMVWSNVPPGRYVLTAVATDDDDASTESKPIEILVVPVIEPPVVNIKTIDAEAAESGPLAVINPAVFSVTRTGSTNNPLYVFYRIGGTASNGVDYIELSGQVTIPSGAVSNRIVVSPLEDSLVEGTETVILKLIHPPIATATSFAPIPYYRIGSNDVARAVILDDDAVSTNLPPRVEIRQPHDGDIFCAPDAIRLAALAGDPDGRVRTVEFFDGATSLGIVSNNMSNATAKNAADLAAQWFRLNWELPGYGVHILTAVATDNLGTTTTSYPVEIKVLPPERPAVVWIYADDPYGSEGPWLNTFPVASAPNAANDPAGMIPWRTASFTVVRRGDTNDDLKVYYKLEGTAINGVDYLQLPGFVTIPAGQHRAKIIVQPLDDNLVEGTETVVAILQPVFCPAIYPPPPGCYTVGDPHRALAWIFDNDFNQAPRAEMVHPVNGDVFRAGSDIELDVVARDPDGWVSKVEFYANKEKIGEQEIYFIVPPPPGEVQKFSMIWSNVPAGGYTLHAVAIDSSGAKSMSDPVEIKVAEMPGLPVVTIATIDPIASEQDPRILAPPDIALFRVSRTGNLDSALTIHYRVSGSASNGLDYTYLTGELVIPAHRESESIFVNPIDDDLVEGTESVVVSLVQPPCVLSNVVTTGCYLVGQPGRGIAYIRDNDAPNHPPRVGIVSPPNGSVFAAPLDLRLLAAAGDPDGWVRRVEFFDGSNSLGIVYSPVTVLDTAPARLTEVNADVLTDNTLVQPFTLVWSNVPPGKHILTAVAMDNAGDSTRSHPVEIAVRAPGDVPVVRIMATDAVAREGTTNTATFRIRRTGLTNAPLTVYYSIRGTASNGVDYVSIPGFLTIPAGRHGGRIVITPIDDNLTERIETVRLRLITPPFGPDTYEIGRPSRAGAVILDNDCLLLSPEPLADGSVHLRLPVTAGLPFRVEASANLSDWEELSCGYASEDGVNVVEDPGSDETRRFFRVVPEFGELDDE